MSDKTEEATPKRLRRAREDGDSPVSAFASQSLAFFATLVLLPAAAVTALTETRLGLLSAFAEAARTTPSAHVDLGALAGRLLLLTMPVLVATATTAAVASLVQSGGVFAPKKLQPKLERLSPIEGAKQIVSLTRVAHVARSAAMGGAVAYLSYALIRDRAADLHRVTGSVGLTLSLAAELSMSLAKRAAALGLSFGLIDVLLTRRSWFKRLRMSKEEVKREHKESDGDPQLKAARDRAHQEVLFSVTLGNVKKAQVVIVNPTHIACALAYEDGDEAPVVVAGGQGALAERIVRAAREYGVPVLRDVPLARAVAELEIGQEIPEALYEAVADVLRQAWDEGDGDDGVVPSDDAPVAALPPHRRA